VFASDDPVFAWAVAKALLIAIVAFAVLIYAAWAATRQRQDAAHVGTLKDGALKYEGSVERARFLSLPAEQTEETEATRHILARGLAEEINVREPGQPAAAA
jgi:hypothetical protein